MMLEYKNRVRALSKVTDNIAAAHVENLQQWYEKLSEEISEYQKQNDYNEITRNEKNLWLNTKANYQKEIEALHAKIDAKKSVINELMKTKEDLKNEFSEIDNSCITIENDIEKHKKIMDEKQEMLKFYRRLTGVDFNPIGKYLTGYTYNGSNGNIKPIILDVDDPDKHCEIIWKQLENQFM